MKTLYYSLIHSHLGYGILVWGSSTQNVIKQTTMLQKRAIRIINRAYYNSHTDPLFRKSRVLKLDDLYHYSSVLFMFDYRTENLPPSFAGKYILNRDMPNARPTRQSNLYNVSMCRNKFMHRLPQYQLPTMWNGWSASIENLKTRGQVKNHLKHAMFLKYPLVVKCRNSHCRECSE